MNVKHNLLAATLLAATATSALAAGGTGIISNNQSSPQTILACPDTVRHIAYINTQTGTTVTPSGETGTLVSATLGYTSFGKSHFTSLNCVYAVLANNTPTKMRSIVYTLKDHYFKPVNLSKWPLTNVGTRQCNATNTNACTFTKN